MREDILTRVALLEVAAESNKERAADMEQRLRRIERNMNMGFGMLGIVNVLVAWLLK